MLRGQTTQLCPFSSKYWESLAKWYYNIDYNNMFRQYTRMFTEDDFKAYDKVVGGEVFMIHSLADSLVIGMIQIIPCYKKNKGGYLGLIIDKAHQNKHIPHEVTFLLLDYLFNRQGYNKVIVEILESDEGLKKTLEKTGWYKEGKLLQECFIDGKFQNELRYSISSYYFNKIRDKTLQEYKNFITTKQEV